MDWQVLRISLWDLKWKMDFEKTYYQVFNKITYPQTAMVQLLKFGNGWLIFRTNYQACGYVSMVEFKLTHVSKRGLQCRIGLCFIHCSISQEH